MRLNIGKLYTWSVATELLLYFLFAHQNITAVSLTLSRIIQIIVICLMILRADYFINQWRVLSINSIFNRWFYIFILYLIVISILGFIIGEYDSNIEYRARDNESIIANILNGPSIRPIFEIFINVYYFLYFAILPRVFLKNKPSINYFFKIFGLLFIISTIAGILDFSYYSFFKSNLISRHFYDGVDSGFRFHGFAGEPRDAFVYIVLGFGIYTLRNLYNNTYKLNIWVVLGLIVLLIMTKSLSGVIGLFFTLLMVMIFYIRKSTIKQKIAITFTVLISIVLLFVVLFYTERLYYYLGDLENLYNALLVNNYKSLNYLGGQLPSIFPVWDRWLELKNYNLHFIFFGSGSGTSSVVNNNYFPYAELANPHSQIIRIFYEAGVIGIYLFVIALIKPIRRLQMPYKMHNMALFSMLLLTGAYFAHRSAAIFIFYGIFVIVATDYSNKESENTNTSFNK